MTILTMAVLTMAVLAMAQTRFAATAMWLWRWPFYRLDGMLALEGISKISWSQQRRRQRESWSQRQRQRVRERPRQREEGVRLQPRLAAQAVCTRTARRCSRATLL